MKKKQQTSTKNPSNGDTAPNWVIAPATIRQFSVELCAGICKQTTTSKDDLNKVRVTLNGYMGDAAGEQPLRDYIASEAFDKRSVLMGSLLTLTWTAGWFSDHVSTSDARGSDYPHARISAALMGLVCDILDTSLETDQYDVLAIMDGHLGNKSSFGQVVKSESLDAQSAAAGAMLALTLFENMNATVAPILPILQRIRYSSDQLNVPLIIQDAGAHEEALKESWAVLQFTLFGIHASEQQHREIVLRYNALKKQCRLPPGAEMVAIDDPELQQPILMGDLIHLIKHMEGIHQFITQVNKSALEESTDPPEA